MPPFQEIQYIRWSTRIIYFFIIVVFILYLFNRMAFYGTGIICIPLLFRFCHKMTVVVSDNTIYIKRYFRTKAILLKNIKSITSYNNYKMPFLPKHLKETWSINFNNSVVEIVLKTGETIIIGTQDKESLQATIESRLKVLK